MQMQLISFVTEGQNALIQVTGNDEPAYIVVSVTRALAVLHVVPVPEDPTAGGRRRVLAASPPGAAFNVACLPGWETGDTVTFTLFDRATDTQQDVPLSALVI